LLGPRRTRERVKSVSEPRRHHYVPAFYLAGFSDTQRMDGDLWVLDKKELSQFRTTARNAAVERDFYRVDSGDDPSAVERALSEIESEAARILRTIVRSRSLPKGEDLERLLLFVAFMYARVPGRRLLFAESMEKLTKQTLQLIFESEERYEAVRKRMEHDGVTFGDISFKQLREFVYSDRLSVEPTRDTYLAQMLREARVLFPLLIKRSWYLLVVEEDAGDLVCSDCPVSLNWIDRERGFWSPGFGLAGTIVTMPLDKTTALAGLLEPVSGRMKVGTREVAQVNSMTGMYAERFIYSPTQDFLWLRSDGSVCGVEKLLEDMSRVSERER